MKQFLIRYRRTEGSPEDWHREIGKFIAAIEHYTQLKSVYVALADVAAPY